MVTKKKKDHDKLEKKDNRPTLVIVQPDSCIQVMVVDVQGREKGKAARWGRRARQWIGGVAWSDDDGHVIRVRASKGSSCLCPVKMRCAGEGMIDRPGGRGIGRRPGRPIVRVRCVPGAGSAEARVARLS